VTSILVVGITVAAIALSNGNSNQGATPPASGCDTSKGTLAVGAIIPETGGLSGWGAGVKNSARLAIDEANEKSEVSPFS
jgi:branched-chain amino acid transport system substrate-binding protein